MSFGYNINIPFSTHNPSNDQPLMEENFNTINSWVAIDHVGFNNAAGGQHEQVTFNDVTTQVAPTNPTSILYTANDAFGNAQLNFLNAQNLANVVGAAGSILTFAGVIFKWNTNVGALDNNAISFAVPFPNNCYAVVANAVNTVTSQNAIVIVGAITRTSFTPRILTAAGTPISGTINWIAIGN